MINQSEHHLQIASKKNKLVFWKIIVPVELHNNQFTEVWHPTFIPHILLKIVNKADNTIVTKNIMVCIGIDS